MLPPPSSPLSLFPLYVYLLFFLVFCSFFRFSPPSLCPLREPAGKLALGYELEAYNHMLDIFMEGVCVCKKQAGGGVCLLVEMYYSVQ